MTRKEFSDRFDACMRYGSRHAFWITLPVFALLFAAAPLSDFVLQHYGDGLANAAVAILLVLSIGALAAGALLLNRRFAKKFGLLCSGCGRQLTDKPTHRKLLMTGNCPKCQCRLFGPIELKAGISAGLLDRDNFQAQLDSWDRNNKRALTRSLLWLFSGILVSAVIGGFFQSFVDRGGLDWITDVEIKWAAGGVFTALVLSIGGLVFASRKKFKIRSLPCPECGRSLVEWSGRRTMETGSCIYCGCKLFEVPPSSGDGVLEARLL